MSTPSAPSRSTSHRRSRRRSQHGAASRSLKKRDLALAPLVVEGDLAVMLWNSGYGQTPAVTHALHHLGIGLKIGRSRPLSSEDPTAVGNLIATAHLIRVRPLVAAAVDRIDVELLHTRGRRVRRSDYTVHGRPAALLDFDEDDQFRVELYDGYYSMSWSTGLGVATLVEEARDLLPAAVTSEHDGSIAFKADTHEKVEGTVDAVLGRLRGEPGSFSFARLDFPTFALTWEAPNYRHDHVSRFHERGRVGIIADVLDGQFVERLIRATGTVALEQRTAEMLEAAGYLERYVEAGAIHRPPR